ncbi:MAG: lytic transglycosylase domain-containing protein [Alphaproteobacteria bacterium]|nr:lytic transglycosylase domain-containing protein [Alphaproteobacteria bacterium]
MTKIIAACLMLAAQTYAVPPAVLVGIYQVEGGTPGQAVGPNDNGTYDLGPMQINTVWIPELAQHWGVANNTALQWVKNDPCTNMGVAAWILRNHIDETGDLAQAIAHYHSRTPRFGYAYRGRVVTAMRSKGLLRDDATK